MSTTGLSMNRASTSQNRGMSILRTSSLLSANENEAPFGRLANTPRALPLACTFTAAGGPLYPAATGSTQVVRTQRSGIRTVINADVPGIIEGKEPDIALEAGDIIYVPAFIPKLPIYWITTLINNFFRVGATVPVV